MTIQDHFWPEDLERAIPVLRDAAHSLLDHLLLSRRIVDRMRPLRLRDSEPNLATGGSAT
jgi:hypothetical protein